MIRPCAGTMLSGAIIDYLELLAEDHLRMPQKILQQSSGNTRVINCVT
jgi:hypothetical protein